jgi:fimbrial chaperone protein
MTTFASIPRGRAAFGVVGGMLLSLLTAASASAFQIVPISQDFEPTGRGANQTFQVENDRQEAVTVTVAMALRKVDSEGRETLTPTEDFTLFPTEIVLQPKTSRIVRAKWIGDTAPKSELSYRIIAEETPLNMRRDTPGASVFLTVRYVGSIYVVPKGVRADIVVSSAQSLTSAQGQPQLELVLENKGTKHAILDAPAITIVAGGVSRPLDKAIVDKALSGENILAQSQRRIVLPWPQGVPVGAVKAELKYSVQ